MTIVRRRPRRREWRAAVWLIAAACAVAGIVGAGVASDRIQSPDSRQERPASSQTADLERQARATCGSCHAFPPPDILPRGSWRDEFVLMMFIREGRLPPLGPPGIAFRNVQLPPDFESGAAVLSRQRPGTVAGAGALARG